MKRITRIGLSAAVALGMLAMVPGAAFAAQPSCGDTLMANTTLTADLVCTSTPNSTAALYFGKKGITLNLNGHTIWGPTGSDTAWGVDTNTKKHVTVKNGTISDFQLPLYAVESVGGTFKNLTIQCDPDDSTPDGVYVSSGVGNALNMLHIDGCNKDIELYGSSANWITNNHLTNGYYGVYDEYDSLDHFVNNYAEYSYAGFYEDYSGGQTYTGNTANGDNSDTDSYGFHWDCGTYGFIWATDNEAWANGDDGFYMYECYDEYNNTAQPTLMDGNSSHDNPGDGAHGFYDHYSINATWTNNVAKNNESSGFELYEPGFVTFKGNVANHNGSEGIYVEDNYSTAYNFAKFANNKANNNDVYGIEGDYGIAHASGNTAHGNGNAPDDCYNVECHP